MFERYDVEVLGREEERKGFRERIKEVIREIRELGLIGFIRERRKKYGEVEFQIMSSEGIEEVGGISEKTVVVPEKEETSVNKSERRRLRGL